MREALIVGLVLAMTATAAARRPHHGSGKRKAPAAQAVAQPATAPAPAAATAAPSATTPPRAMTPATATSPRSTTAPPATTSPAPSSGTPSPGGEAAPKAVSLGLPHALPSGETRCVLCHTTGGWEDVRFAHERTGFPLAGAHRKVTCKSCHPSGFAKAVPDRCSGCHRDVHASEFGLHCEGCHDESSWRTNFTADAHRRSNFPLTGRHALIPCVECHPNVRDRSFARAAVECGSCHLADYQRTAMTSLDHAAAGLPMSCQQCHLPWRWQPASFGQHDQCFTISRGPHSGIRCTACHTSIANFQVTGQCMTNTAACTNCHEHDCARTDGIHRSVPGYQCKDRKCYECHHF